MPDQAAVERQRRVVLDTDLGSDVDDALALAVLLGSPEVDLLGATTVYGDVTLRARLARGFAALAGRDLTVTAGIAEPLSGRPVWVSGDEGKHFPDVGSAPIDPNGVDWLLEQARQAPGELEIVAIGPLTNLAYAVRTDPLFASSIRRVWLMGGLFAAPRSPSPAAQAAETAQSARPGAPAETGGPAEMGGPAGPIGSSPTGGRPDDEPAEHNFAADAVAADAVLRSGLPITVLGVELTRRLRLYEPEIAELGALGALGAQLERETRAWTAYWNEPSDVPHDAIAVIAMLRPELFSRREARVRVITDGEHAGRIIEDGMVDDAAKAPDVVLHAPGRIIEDGTADVVLDDAGRNRGSALTIVTDLDIPAVTREILDRIRVASQGEPCAT